MTNSAMDRISGVIFVLIGLAVMLGAWAMPRFEAQGAPIYQAPGLTPALLGLALAICGAILALRPSRADGAEQTYWNTVFGSPANRRRALAALFLTVTYGAVLFGSAPFIAATFLFVFAFIMTFEQVLAPADVEAKAPLWRSGVTAALIAGAIAFGCHYVFETLFLVRLP